MVEHTMSVRLTDVSVRRRGKTILGPLSLALADSGFTVVLGPNGAGKTTLLKALHGLDRISGGQVEWAGGNDAAHASQAYVFQSPIMLRRSVRQNLAYPLRLLGVPKADIAIAVQDWAERVGLSDFIDRRATRLSGGEKQKLALARALIRRPKVLFLDEPCANLDGRSTREIEALLLDTWRTGTRIIMTTHDMGQARRLASDVVFLLNGAVCEQGDAAAFFANPGTEQARAFLKGDIVE